MHILKCTAHFFIKFWIDGFVATCIYYFAKYIRVHLIVNIDDANYTCCRNLPKICPNPKVQNSGSKLQPNSKIRPKSEIRVGVRKSERNLFYMCRLLGLFGEYCDGFLDFSETNVPASWTFRRLMLLWTFWKLMWLLLENLDISKANSSFVVLGCLQLKFLAL